MPTHSKHKLIFLHTPRTGGTTVASVLRRLYPGAFNFCTHPSLEEILRLLGRFDCLELHVGEFEGEVTCFTKEILRAFREDLLRECRMFVMLRDPVEQVISTFYYLTAMRSDLEGYYQKRGVPFPESFREWLECPATGNLQLAFLLGKLPRSTDETLAPHDLEVAKRTLSSAGITIGITERFDESLYLLENVTGRRIPAGKVTAANRNPKRPDSALLDTDIRRLVRTMNSLDVQLYEHAVRLFEAQLAQYPYCTRRYFQETGEVVHGLAHECR